MKIKTQKKTEKKVQDRSELKTLCQRIVNLEQQIREWEESYENVFTHWRELMTEKEGVTEAIKTEARKFSTPGNTEVLAESASLFVSVQGRLSPLEYDYSKASLMWPSEVLAKVTTSQIDTKKLAGFIEAGILDKDTAAKAALPRTPQTPAVTIKLP